MPKGWGLHDTIPEGPQLPKATSFPFPPVSELELGGSWFFRLMGDGNFCLRITLYFEV